MSEETRISKVEAMKRDSNHLRGQIADALQDGSSHFSEENIQILKFHGVYQQDDRDVRRQLAKEGKERQYSLMIRARIPGGRLNAKQYLQFDRLSELYGNRTMRITTRQTFQLHGVLKGDLKRTIREINDVLITTLGGCGDQTRNIVSCPEPHEGMFYDEVRSDLLALVDALSARTNAYHEIWLDGERLSAAEHATEEPLYGEVYLPRKFKVGIAYEGDNCIDVYANDIGIVAHPNGSHVAGYTVLVGGGMGRNAADVNTYPRVATPLGFVTREQLVDVCKAVLIVQRDHGNRTERKYARMKYLIDKHGETWFKQQVEGIAGWTLEPARSLHWSSTQDHLGLHRYGARQAYVGLFVENGRIKDTETMKLKTALREVMTEFAPDVCLTTQQNIILSGLTDEQAEQVEARFLEYGVPLPQTYSKVKVESMACPALPTCGLAVAESERVLPEILAELEETLTDLGIEKDPLSVRMTGCPNGCARPYLAEIGFVGRALGKYDLFLGANPDGSRINHRYKELIPLDQLVSAVRPLLAAYKANRADGERFGNFVDRIGFDQLKELESIFSANPS